MCTPLIILWSNSGSKKCDMEEVAAVMVMVTLCISCFAKRSVGANPRDFFRADTTGGMVVIVPVGWRVVLWATPSKRFNKL
jgi:hypothetical protein